MCQQKVQKQEFCDSVCYKIPYFTDSCELRILHGSVTRQSVLQNFCELRIIILHELATSKLKRWQSFGITSHTICENVELVK